MGLIENDKQPSLIDYRVIYFFASIINTVYIKNNFLQHRNTLNVEPYLKEEPTDNDETVNPTHDNSEIPDTREYPKRFDNHAFSEPLSEDFIELIRETLKRREEREERAILQQEQITNVLLLLNTNLEKMSDLLEKFTDKLDKL